MNLVRIAKNQYHKNRGKNLKSPKLLPVYNSSIKGKPKLAITQSKECCIRYVPSSKCVQVRDRGRDLKAAPNGWMRPEIRHNMAGPLSLADRVKRGTDTQREERATVWQRAHSKHTLTHHTHTSHTHTASHTASHITHTHTCSCTRQYRGRLSRL